MSDEDRLAILNEVYDNIEYLSDAEIEASELLDDYTTTRLDSIRLIKAWDRRRPKPEPLPPPARKLDTRNSIEAICDARIAAYDRKLGEPFKKVIDSLLAGTGDALGKVRAALEDEIAALRRELSAARQQIKELQREKSVIGWKLDRAKYRVVPFYADGRPGTPIPLRPLFEQYHDEANR